MSPQLFGFFSDAHLRFQKYNQHPSAHLTYSFQLDITQVHDLSARRKLLTPHYAKSRFEYIMLLLVNDIIEWDVSYLAWVLGFAV
jgi:hypothetical protein